MSTTIQENSNEEVLGVLESAWVKFNERNEKQIWNGVPGIQTSDVVENLDNKRPVNQTTTTTTTIPKTSGCGCGF